MYAPKGSQLIYKKQSPYQKICLYQHGNHFWMGLNDVLQFHTGECYMSHQFMCKIPLKMVSNPRKVLVIGGGDGFAARELLRDPRVKQIINVELDGDLVDMTTKHPVMKALTDGSFSDPRVKVIKGDGIGYLLNTREKFDIIIDDCEYEYTGQPGGREEKRYDAYTRCLVEKLNPGGVSNIMEPLVRVKPFTSNTLGAQLVRKNRYFFDPDGRLLDHRSPVLSVNQMRDRLKERFVESEEFEYWKERAPYVQVAVFMSKIIGPEAYIYMAKHRI